MVLPMGPRPGAGGGGDGPPTEYVIRTRPKLKAVLLAIVVVCFLKMLSDGYLSGSVLGGSPFDDIFDLFTPLFGYFLFKDNATLQACVCGFMFMGFINFVYGIVNVSFRCPRVPSRRLEQGTSHLFRTSTPVLSHAHSDRFLRLFHQRNPTVGRDSRHVWLAGVLRGRFATADPEHVRDLLAVESDKNVLRAGNVRASVVLRRCGLEVDEKLGRGAERELR